MGLIDRLRRWLQERPTTSAPPLSRRTTQDEEDEEIAELIAIDII
jgi:hypothetical protein